MKVQPHTISSEERRQLILFTLKPALNLSAGLQSQTKVASTLFRSPRDLSESAISLCMMIVANNGVL